MNAKGTIFVITKTNMIAGFGDERWNSFMTKLVEKDNYFSNKIMSISLVPVEKMIIFFDEMCKEFFNMKPWRTVADGRRCQRFWRRWPRTRIGSSNTV